MKPNIFSIILLSSLLAVSCTGYDEPSVPEKMPLVVEGWIEEDESPVVIVTHAVDLTDNAASFDDFVEKWGRVSVFDGDTRYVLTGRLNRDYMPSFIFTSANLKGKVGHTYRLLIETETDTVEAVSTMLPAPELQPLAAVRAAVNDSAYFINAKINDIDPNGCYKFFIKSSLNDSRFYGAFLGTFKGHDYDPENGFNVTRGIHATYDDSADTDHFFYHGDRVTVKLCSLGADIYDFWRVYDNNVYMSENLFFTFEENCPGNIRGGIGYWAAYGCSKRSVSIP